MGEYANYKGESVKIGTCEDMYYLRADQAHLVQPSPNSVDPVRNRHGIRFRFPFPDEDRIEPGAFENYSRGVTLWGVSAPSDVDHGTVQFTGRNGYLVSLPCPEGSAEQPYKIHRNGYGGATQLVQQRHFGGRLVIVLQCKGCEAKWRLPTLVDAQPVIDALHAYADGQVRDGNESTAVFYRSIADRVTAGYGDTVGSVGD